MTARNRAPKAEREQEKLNPTKLLISGSREASQKMLEYAERTVIRAKQLSWSIIVGDASGVDHAVMLACGKYHVSFHCYGISPVPRHYYSRSGAPDGLGDYTMVPGDYLARDRFMAGLCDRAICIWNGVSRGTLYTHNQVVALGKPSDLMRFGIAAKQERA